MSAAASAMLGDVLQAWAKGNQDKIAFIQGLIPLDIEVRVAFENGKTMNVLEPDVDFPSLTLKHRVWFRSFCFDCEKWSRPGFVQPIERHLDVQKFDSGVSPSAYGGGEWETLQEKQSTEVMHLRPYASSWINIRIMHPALNMVAEAATRGTPERRDYALARELTIVMAAGYGLESQRRDAVNAVLIDHIFCPIGRMNFGVKGIGKYETDGSALQYGVTIEYTNEKGLGGSDPYLQNVAYHGKFWTADKSKTRDGFTKHCCPWLLIEVLGQEMGLAGAAYACNRHCAQPLSPNVPFLPVPADKDMLLLQARICMALRVGATDLCQFYRTAELLPVSRQAPYPYPRQAKFDGSADLVPFEYTGVWGGIKHRKMLFEAKQLDSSANIMVKFTDTYGKEVHEVLYKAGHAPELHDIQEQCGMFMVVMECIEGTRSWCDEDALDETLKEQLLNVQKVLEGNGFVHGDLRAPNVRVNVTSKKIFILDFDWAGISGETHYPVILNPNVTWPPKAQVGAAILIEHDRFMIAEMTSGRKRKNDT
jgi:hypothetical protein